MRLVQDEEVVEALPADGADEPLHERVLPGRVGGGQNLADPHARDASREGFPVDPISIPKQILGSRIIRERLDELLALGERTHFRPRMCPGIHWRMSICLFQCSAKP
jgi:hypothetical protein